MIQSEQQRRAYLDALGIDVWVRRGLDESLAANVEEPQAESVLPAPGNATPWASDWAALEQRVRSCEACELAKTRTQTVFGVGNRDADWMIIGEAPGAEEDRRGEPFVGRAGQLLDEMLRAIGLSRDGVFIANILKCRPPNNRDPKQSEADACRGYLDAQIALVKPRILLAVGRIAAQQLLGRDDPVGRLRGRVHYLGETPVVVTYHPAYLLRSPAQKARAWQDLCLARSAMAGSI